MEWQKKRSPCREKSADQRTLLLLASKIFINKDASFANSIFSSRQDFCLNMGIHHLKTKPVKNMDDKRLLWSVTQLFS